MKNKFLLILLTFFLAGCSTNNTSSNSNSESNEESNTSIPHTSENESEEASENESGSTSSEEEQIAEVDSIQDMTILHAWNWKLNDINKRLHYIREAGYGAIQISPLQPKVDKSSYSNENTKSQWWKFYQPLAFKISEGDESLLGTRDDLIKLCRDAGGHNIKIIVDVVSNHLAGSDNTYNSQVYKRYALHDYGKTNDNSIEAVVRGHIGLPDLDTSVYTVQYDVANMLKDYLDCGVSGFRFDAAKHIETPNDGDFASDYWPYVLGQASEHQTRQDKPVPYYYGEVLNTPGKGRSFSDYTSMMSIVDNNQGTDVVNAVNNKSLSSLKKTYNTKENPNHLVLWAESHDTYANDSGYEKTRDFSTEVINKAYIIQASRKDAATLYLARPSSLNASICSIDDSTGWKNQEVAAINKFHRRYVDKEESINNNNGCFVNVRGTGSFAGAVIVNIDANDTQNVEVKGLKDGVYVDLISNNEFTVSHENVNVSFTSGACILIPKGSSTDEGQGNQDESEANYNSSVVVKGYNASLSYLAWTWGNGNDGSWKKFESDKDALGINLNSGDNYIIVEFPNGVDTSNANWDKKIRQTIDMSYSGSQIIHEYDSLIWK